MLLERGGDIMGALTSLILQNHHLFFLISDYYYDDVTFNKSEKNSQLHDSEVLFHRESKQLDLQVTNQLCAILSNNTTSPILYRYKPILCDVLIVYWCI